MNRVRRASALVISLSLAVPAWAQTPMSPDAPPAVAPPAEAAPTQESPPAPQPNFFKLIGGDFRHFFSKDTAHVMGFFAVAAAGTAPWDREGINNGFNIPTSLFEAGNIAGNFVVQAAGGFATYGVGRAFGSRKTAAVGRDIVRAQILSQAWVQGLKFTIRRERPDRSNRQSFPSGHSASAFATAGVMHHHYGWKVGAPAYLFGSYVALARMAYNRHHATDVVMGAGFGLAAARAVTIKVAGNTFSVGVQPQAGGASINFQKIYR